MCTASEEDLDIAHLNLEKRDNDLKDSVCKKCSQEKASVILRTKDPYCRVCFLKCTTHKFRAALGKGKVVRPKDRILVASSGSQSSVALLHLVAKGLSEQNNKRFLFTPLAAYIDEGAVTELSRDERLEAIKVIAKQAEDLSFPFYTVQLSNSLKLESMRILKVNSKGEGIDMNENGMVVGDEQLTSLFNATKSLTSKEDLLDKLRYNLLIAVAKELDCCKVLLADNGSQLAVKLITNISLGRGAHLPWESGFCDVRDPDVMILRPLKELMGKEVAFYCTFNQLSTLALPSLGMKTLRMGSVRRLTEDFLFGLHLDFPSTFSAVIRTGDKLAQPVEGLGRCVLCKVTLDQQYRECSSWKATQFSKELVRQINSRSEVLFTGRMAESDEPSGRDLCHSSNVGGPLFDNVKWKVEDCLCYGCQLIAADMDDADTFFRDLFPLIVN